MKSTTFIFAFTFLMGCSHSVQPSAATQDSTQISKKNTAQATQNTVSDDVSISNDADIPKTEPVDTHETCFRNTHKISEMLVVSSIGMMHVDNTDFWVAQTPEGNVKVFKSQGDTFENRSIAQNAQIACYESLDTHFRLGWIVRNAQDGTFKLEIHDFNAELVENRDEFWLASTRGFIPDAGTKCAFLGRRDLIVVGTRPRGDHVPLHGFFHLQSRALKLIDGTSEHVPLLESAIQKDGKTQLLMRTVERDAENKPQWPFGIYKLIDSDEESQIEKEFSADFIVAYEDNWLSFDKSGCFLKQGNKICPNQPLQIREIRALSGMCEDAICVEMLSYQENWIAKIQGESMSMTAIPTKMRLFEKTHRSTNEWLTITMDDVRPDVTDGLEFVEIDKACLGI